MEVCKQSTKVYEVAIEFIQCRHIEILPKGKGPISAQKTVIEQWIIEFQHFITLSRDVNWQKNEGKIEFLQ